MREKETGRERACVCVRERVSERELVCVCVFVCVCERERARESDRTSRPSRLLSIRLLTPEREKVIRYP